MLFDLASFKMIQALVSAHISQDKYEPTVLVMSVKFTYRCTFICIFKFKLGLKNFLFFFNYDIYGLVKGQLFFIIII